MDAQAFFHNPVKAKELLPDMFLSVMFAAMSSATFRTRRGKRRLIVSLGIFFSDLNNRS